MADSTFQCTVITPEEEVFDGRVEAVVMPAHDGEIGILRDRAPLMCKLGPGRMRVRHEGSEESWYIDAGFAQVLDNRVTVLTQKAMRPDSIDRTAAEAMLAEARQMKPTDEVAARRKAQLEARARAQLRIGIG